MANFNVDGNATSTLNQISFLPADIGVFLFAINTCLSFTAILGNALILIALRKVSSLHPPSKLLLGCLAVTDLGVGLTSQPLFAIYILAIVTEINWIISFLAKVFPASSFLFCGVSIFTSSAISVDRLLALLLGLRYRHFVTLKRVNVVISCLWLAAFSIMLISLFYSYFVALTVAVVLSLVFMVISVFSYTKIFLTLRHQQAQVQAHVQGQPNIRGMPLNVARYKKTVSSIAWVQLALVACYAPFVISVIRSLSDYSVTTAIAFYLTTTFFYLNSSLNPLLYCWKIREVRQAVKATIRQFCCC